MLIARAPLQLSLAGEGTDLEAYYTKYGGAVVSTTIDKYIYVFVSPSDREAIEVSSANSESWGPLLRWQSPSWDEGRPLSIAVLEHFGIHRGVSMFLASEVDMGDALGSASALTVALIKSMSTVCGQRLTRAKIAELACSIEIEKLGMPVGKQDAYGTAYGGVNYVEFTESDVNVEPLHLPGESLSRLQERLLLFYIGRRRPPEPILKEQKRSSERNRASVIAALHGIRDAAVTLRSDLATGNVAAVGTCLDATWEYKRKLAHGVSDPWIDDWYRRARSAGAAGGKLTGAGGGGFLLLYCEPEFQEQLIRTLNASGLQQLKFHFDSAGPEIMANRLGRWKSSSASHA